MVKTYEQFLNENLAGEYCYFGSNALIPIAAKLQAEGRNAKQIYDYLTSLGVQERQKMHIINSLSGIPGCVLENIDDLVSSDIEDEIANIKKKKGDNGEEKKDDEETDDSERESDETSDKEDSEEDVSKETEMLKKVLKDQEKLDKIKSILKEHKTIDKSQSSNDAK